MSEEDLDSFQIPDIVPHATHPPCSTTHPDPTFMIADAIQLPLPFHITAEPPFVEAHLARLTKEQ